MQQKLGGNPRKKGRAEEAQDKLTGVLKKNIAESRIIARMNETQGGTLFLCSVDGMKRINEQYGLLTGDEYLKQAARILSYMSRQDDILARRSGDEFEIFMPGCQDAQQAQEICQRIHDRFRTNGGTGDGRIPLSVTVVWAQRRPGDTWRELLGRADEELYRQRTALESATGQDKRGKGYIKDVRQIRKDLMEQIQRPGAYCQDYETFKGIYRFLARGIIRSGQKVCVSLITVVNGEGGSPRLYEKDVLMEQLGETIKAVLRIGDVYTRYSSSQYLLLAINTEESQVDTIVERIREQFLAGRQGNDVLIHSCYELEPAQIEETLEPGNHGLAKTKRE